MKIIGIVAQLVLILLIVPFACYTQEANLTFILTEITIIGTLLPIWNKKYRLIYNLNKRVILQVTNPTFHLKSQIKLQSAKEYDNLLETLRKAIEGSKKFTISKCIKITDLKYQIDLKSNDKNLASHITIFNQGEYIYIDLIDSNIGYRDAESIINYVAELTEITSKSLGINNYIIGMTLDLENKNPFLGLYFQPKFEQNDKISTFHLNIKENQTTDVRISLDKINISSNSYYDFSSIAKQYLLFKKLPK